jgi:hypothetical protein
MRDEKGRLHCEECGKVIKPREPVYVAKRGGYQRGKVRRCEPCAEAIFVGLYLSHRPCEGCGREVSVDYELQDYRHLHCCDAVCGRKARLARLLQKARDARQKTCARCGKAFKATRNDGRFCSSACRQAAYRDRLRKVAETPHGARLAEARRLEARARAAGARAARHEEEARRLLQEAEAEANPVGGTRDRHRDRVACFAESVLRQKPEMTFERFAEELTKGKQPQQPQPWWREVWDEAVRRARDNPD